MKPLSPKSLEKKYAELGLPKAKTDWSAKSENRPSARLLSVLCQSVRYA